jgi:hypothetical protein
MTSKFELTIDKEGKPIIKFSHQDKNDSIEQKLLKVFIDNAFKNGISLRKVSGYTEIGGNVSFDNYEIIS